MNQLDQKGLPTLMQIVSDPSTPSWVHALIKTLSTRDIVDNANILEVLAAVYARDCDAYLKAAAQESK